MPGSPQVGEEFAGYRLESEIGRGGMSVVFLAQNWRLQNYVALKVLAPEFAHDATFRTRFLHESRIAASLNHPHVVPIIDFDAEHGHLYIAMRYVAGTDLGQMIAERGRLDPATAVHLLSQAALALDAAHRRGLVHRDVKPANLLIERTSDDADPDHLYLADFGITKYVSRPSGLTRPGSVWGTARYFAPEQAQRLIVQGAADQYALGLVLYECLTGQVPFAKDSGAALAELAYIRGEPPRATQFRPELPPAIDRVFDRVFAMHPNERYPSCYSFMAAANKALAMPGRVPGGGRSPEFQPAPLPPGGLPGVREPLDVHWMATEDVLEPLPGSWQPPGEVGRAGVAHPGERQQPGEEQHSAEAQHAGEGDAAGEPPRADDWSFYSADGGGDGGRPARRRRVRSRRGSWVRSHVTLSSVIALAVLAAAGAGAWYLTGTHTPARSASASQPPPSQPPPSQPPPSQPTATTARSSTASPLTGPLSSVLDQTSMYVPPGYLDLSACREPSPTDLECKHPSPGIKTVSFVTYPTLSALYKHYEAIIHNLTKPEPFAAVENKGVCGEEAPVPPAAGAKATGENTWNLLNNVPTTYTADQMATGAPSVNLAMGRVFCEQMGNGSEYIVWTQDSGKFLGYATGAAPDAQVYQWWHYVHRGIIFPGQPGMPSTMPTPPAAGSAPATAATGSAAAPATAVAVSGSSPATAASVSGSSPTSSPR
jgi:serine/threonine-protein kinase